MTVGTPHTRVGHVSGASMNGKCLGGILIFARYSLFARSNDSFVGDNGTDLHLACCISSQPPKICTTGKKTAQIPKRDKRAYLDKGLLRLQQSTRQPVPESKKLATSTQLLAFAFIERTASKLVSCLSAHTIHTTCCRSLSPGTPPH